VRTWGLAACLLSAGCTLVNHVNQIRFADGGVAAAFFDDFDSPTLKEGWIFGGGDGVYALENGHLLLETSSPRPDDTCTGLKLSCVRMLRPALSPGTGESYQARFDGPPPGQSQEYGLLLFDGAQNFIRFYVSAGVIRLAALIGGAPLDFGMARSIAPSPSLDLRVTRGATGFRFEYRTSPTGLWDTYSSSSQIGVSTPTQVGVELGAHLTPFSASIDSFEADRTP
jgi:hypothetical protein